MPPMMLADLVITGASAADFTDEGDQQRLGNYLSSLGTLWLSTG